MYSVISLFPVLKSSVESLTKNFPALMYVILIFSLSVLNRSFILVTPSPSVILSSISYLMAISFFLFSVIFCTCSLNCSSIYLAMIFELPRDSSMNDGRSS